MQSRDPNSLRIRSSRLQVRHVQHSILFRTGGLRAMIFVTCTRTQVRHAHGLYEAAGAAPTAGDQVQTHRISITLDDFQFPVEL